MKMKNMLDGIIIHTENDKTVLLENEEKNMRRVQLAYHARARKFLSRHSLTETSDHPATHITESDVSRGTIINDDSASECPHVY